MTLSATAQTVAPQPPASNEPEPKKIALPRAADTAKTADENADAAEDVVQLAPFVVAAESDRGYQATSTLAGTRLRTELRDVGAAISVVNAQFLADTASTNAKDVLVYTTGTEAAGIGGNYSGLSTGQGFSNAEDGLASPNSMTRVRGLSGADLTRDF